MLHISRKTILAIEAVVDISLHSHSGPVQSREITRRQGIPQRYLEQVMQHLVRHDILRGVRGPKGGYILARERRRINIGEIVRVVDMLDTAKDAEQTSRSALSEQLIEPLWERHEAAFLASLDAVTIEELWRDARKKTLFEEGDLSDDFTI